MVATNSVASAMPYDGLNAVRGNPYGANALLNVVIASMLTGSEPMIITDVAQVDVVAAARAGRAARSTRRRSSARR